MKPVEDNEVRTFYSGAKIFVPFMITIAITVSGWIYTAITTAKERGAQQEVIRQQGLMIAKNEGRFEGLEKRVNNHDVVLGQLQVQLARIEKTGDETNNLLNDLVRTR